MAEQKYINQRQQQHIHALLAEMAKKTGQDIVSFRKQMKERYAEYMDYSRPFSLKLNVCKQKEYTLFKDFCINIAMEYGLVFDGIVKYVDEPAEWTSYCLAHRTCVVSGKKHDPDAGVCVDIHHVDTIGMGRDRDSVNDSDCRKMPLLREYHTICHSMGQASFEARYHVVGIVTKRYKNEEDVIDSGKVEIE